MRPHTIVIIGAGFSGTATAIQLMRQATAALNIVLVNKSGRMARGLAYGTNSPEHVLNVPAGNMSALPEEPDNFLDYCRWADPTVHAHSFVSRALYGAYLDALLSTAEAQGGAAGQVTLERMVGEVTDISAGSPSVTVTLDDGRRVECDEVVLAFGHFPPSDVLPRAELDTLGTRYIAAPWFADQLHTIPRNGDVLLVGTGLTALDVLISLHGRGHEGRIVCLSRRGLMPRSHRLEGALPGVVDGAALAAEMGGSLRRQVRVLRETTRAAMARGEDWRDCIGALRPHTPALWHAMTVSDRRRFLRHVRPYWDVLRHRCAPSALDLLNSLQNSGRVQSLAGRLCNGRLNSAGDTAELTFKLRGTAGTDTRRFDAVVNCTGPSNDLRRCGVPLLERLLARRQICADPLGLGLTVDQRYTVLDAHGLAQPWLRYIGPMLKARDWEAIAVPELRVHARQLAADLLATRCTAALRASGDLAHVQALAGIE